MSKLIYADLLINIEKSISDGTKDNDCLSINDGTRGAPLKP